MKSCSGLEGQEDEIMVGDKLFREVDVSVQNESVCLSMM